MRVFIQSHCLFLSYQSLLHFNPSFSPDSMLFFSESLDLLITIFMVLVLFFHPSYLIYFFVLFDSWSLLKFQIKYSKYVDRFHCICLYMTLFSYLLIFVFSLGRLDAAVNNDLHFSGELCSNPFLIPALLLIHFLAFCCLKSSPISTVLGIFCIEQNVFLYFLFRP